MKRFLALILFVSLIATPIKAQTTGPEIGNRLLHELVEEFISEAQSRGYDVREEISNSVTSINFEHVEFPAMGYYNPQNGAIRVADYLIVDKAVLRLTLFHEIGHALFCDGKHECIHCAHIMSANQIDYGPALWNKQTWKMLLDNFFSKLDKE